jgi:hypothetical protein
MGEVLMFTPRSHSQTKPTKSAPMKPLKADNLDYPKPEDERAAMDLIKALALHGIEAEIVPEDDGA